MIRRLSTLKRTSLFILLMLSPLSIADPVSNLSVSLTGTDYINVANLSVIASDSAACVWDSLGNWDSDSMYSQTTDTSAAATIAYATGYTETENLYVHGEGSATPLGTDGAWVSYGGPYPAPDWAKVQWADQQYMFQADADGTVTFDFLLDHSFDLQTDTQGERAYGYLRATLELWIQSEPWLYDYCGYTNWDLNPGVQDGADYYATDSGVLFSVSSDTPFTAGQNGMLGLFVETSAGAYTEGNPVIPTPAAILLGVVGLLSASLKLRKYA